MIVSIFKEGWFTTLYLDMGLTLKKIKILQMSQVPQGWLDFWHDLGYKKDVGFDVLVTFLKHCSYCMYHTA
jgi:hypothetical protein